jgi:hypothetical protein
MSAIGTVSVSFIANSSGLMAGANAASRAFRSLGGDSSALRASFSALQKVGSQSVADIGPASAAASAGIVRLREQAAALGSAFSSGAATAAQFKEGMSALVAESKALAAATSAAAAITRQFMTDEQRYFEQVDRIADAVKRGGLAEDVATRARAAALATYMQAGAAASAQAVAVDGLAESIRGVASVGAENPFNTSIADEFIASMDAMASSADSAAGVIDSAWLAEVQAAEEARLATAAIEELSGTFARGAAITLQNATAVEQYADKMAELDRLVQAGAISQTTYERAARAAGEAIQTETKSVSTLDAALGGIKTRLNVLIGLDVLGIFGSIASGISGAVSSFVGLAKAEAEVITQTSKMATRLGLAYGEMASLSLAAERTGVSLETMKDAMTKADVSLGRAVNGSKESAAGFEALGLSADQLNTLSLAQRFEAISSAIAKLPSEAQRAAAAVQVFGRSGTDLLPIFEGGASAITDARREAERFGTYLTTAQGKDVKAMAEAFERARTAIQGVVQQVVAYLAPAVTGIVEDFTKFIEDAGGADIGKRIGAGIIEGAKYLAEVADSVVNGFRSAAMAAADSLGVPISKEAKSLNEMQAQISAGLAPQTAVAGSGGFVTELDPAFAAEVSRLTDVVASQRQPLTTFTDLVKKAEELARLHGLNPDNNDNKKDPGPAKAAMNIQVTGVTEALKAIDSRSKEGVAEMFRLMRGSPDSAAQRTANASERTADATEKWLDLQDDVEFAIP